MPENDNGEGRRAGDTQEPVLDPGGGRIMGAGSNHLQRAIDANTRAQQALIAELRKEREERGPGRQSRGRRRSTGRARTTSVTPMGTSGDGEAGEEEVSGRWTAETGRSSSGASSRAGSRTVSVPKMAVPYQQTFQVQQEPDGGRTVTSFDQAPRGAKGSWSRKRTTTVDARGMVTHDDWTERQSGDGFTVPYNLAELHRSRPRPTRWINSGNTIDASTGYSTYRSDGAAAYRAESSGAGSRVFVAGTSGPASLRRPGAAQSDTFRRADGGWSSTRSRTVPLPGGLERHETFTEEHGADGSSVRTTSVRAPRDDGRGFSTRVRTTTTSRAGAVSRSERVQDDLTDLDDDRSDQWDSNRFHGGWGPTGGGGGGTPSGGAPFAWRNLAFNVGRGANKLGSWGGALVKMGVPLDNYAQWAAIAGGGIAGTDGTSGSSVNHLRKAMFGSLGMNTINWAQSTQDASAAAFIASRNSGFTDLMPGSTSAANPQMSRYMQNIKNMAYLDPTADASSLAGTLGSMTSNRGTYGAMMFGYRPMLSRGGGVDRDALGSFTDSVMRRTFQGKNAIAPEELKASLGQNGSLHANVQAYVNSVGGDASMVKTIEDYMTGRNTAQNNGLSGSEFDQLLSEYSAGGAKGSKAEDRLKKFGVANSILQSQKDKDAAKASSVNDLLDQLGPAVKLANEALETFHNWLNQIVNTPGIKHLLGSSLGWGSVFGPAVGSAAGAAAGMSLASSGGGLLSAAGGLMGMRSLAGTGGTAAAGTRGAATARFGGAAGRAGLWGLGALAVNGVGGMVEQNVESSGGQKAVSIATSGGSGALIGAGIGSIVPAIGTGVGAAVGGAIGLGYGAYQNFAGSGSRTTGNDGVGGGDGNKKEKSSQAKNGSTVSGKSAGSAINAALAEVGKPYQWGGVGPDAFDCSGLMQHAYRKAGVRIPRTSQQQMGVGKRVKDLKSARPGDLLFPNPGHVVMYLGNNKIVEAPRTGLKIRVVPASTYSKYEEIRRITGAVGSYDSDGEQDDNTQQPQSGNSGGDSGSMVLSDSVGSTEEVEAVTSALSGVRHTLLNTPMGSSSAGSEEADSGGEEGAGGAASIGSYKWGKIDGKFEDIPAPPGWVQTAIKKGMSAAGVSGAKWARGLVTIAYRESNYRKNAVNNWDSNAKNGTPSKGLMQVIGPTFKAHRAKSLPNDPLNPAASVAASANYIESRYRDISRVQQADPNKSRKGYDVGAWEIPEDHVANVHKGEMIIEKPKADTIRAALMRDVVNMRDASGASATPGSRSGVTINFHEGAVNFTVQGAMSKSAAVEAASAFVGALNAEPRMLQLAKGI
ncbi:NlpC/P60 family protein [Streptomyces sp. NPDC017448]|uniref:NlpC/P60 family protein n=1 Tax=Streptomyces sp. NPDC017448 TaxID=3364996 RepID=UPI0037B96AC7